MARLLPEKVHWAEVQEDPPLMTGVIYEQLLVC